MKKIDTSNFNSFLFISSTRFYNNSKTTIETEKIEIDVNDKNSLYDISKLLGESYCSVEVVPNSPINSSVDVNIDRIKNEFNFKSESILSELENLITYYQKDL